MPNLQQNQSTRDTLRAGNVLTVTVTTGSVGVSIPGASINKTISASESFGDFDRDVAFELSAFSGAVASYAVADKYPLTDNTSRTIQVSASRELTQSDNGLTLDCTTSGLTLTAPAGLVNFGCAIINNTTTIAFSGGATGNGAATSIALTANVGAIVPTSTANAYKVVG